MSEPPSTEGTISVSRPATLDITYPRRTQLLVERVDWRRLEQCIRRIPEQRSHYRDAAYCSAGVAGEALVAAILVAVKTPLRTLVTSLPQALVIYSFVVAVAGVVAFLCFLNSRAESVHRSHRVSEALEEMDTIESYSATSQEVLDAQRRVEERESGPLVIHWAKYGAEDTYRDVTQIVRDHVVGNRVTLAISNDTLGGDPTLGIPKVSAFDNFM